MDNSIPLKLAWLWKGEAVGVISRQSFKSLTVSCCFSFPCKCVSQQGPLPRSASESL